MTGEVCAELAQRGWRIGDAECMAHGVPCRIRLPNDEDIEVKQDITVQGPRLAFSQAVVSCFLSKPLWFPARAR